MELYILLLPKPGAPWGQRCSYSFLLLWGLHMCLHNSFHWMKECKPDRWCSCGIERGEKAPPQSWGVRDDQQGTQMTSKCPLLHEIQTSHWQMRTRAVGCSPPFRPSLPCADLREAPQLTPQKGSAWNCCGASPRGFPPSALVACTLTVTSCCLLECVSRPVLLYLKHS